MEKSNSGGSSGRSETGDEENKRKEAISITKDSFKAGKSDSSNDDSKASSSGLVSVGNNSYGFNFDSMDIIFNQNESTGNDNCNVDENGVDSSSNRKTQSGVEKNGDNKKNTPTNETQTKSPVNDVAPQRVAQMMPETAVSNLRSIVKESSEHWTETNTPKAAFKTGNLSNNVDSSKATLDISSSNSNSFQMGTPNSGNTSAAESSVNDKKSRNGSGKSKREERNAREKERSFRISRQINDLRALLSAGGVIVPKGTKSSVLTEAANYIRMLQQHQYRSEIDRHQLVQQMQMIGKGALGPQAQSIIRYVAAQNGVWSLGSFGGVPPRSTLSTGSGNIEASNSSVNQNVDSGQPMQGGTTSLDPKQTGIINSPHGGSNFSRIEDNEYRCVFNSCAIALAIASMGGAFIDCNELFCELSGYTKQEVCSMTIFNLTNRNDLQHAFDLISQMISPPSNITNQDESLNTNSAKNNQVPCILRGAMKNRSDLGLSITFIKGEDDGVAKSFCVTLVKNPPVPSINAASVTAAMHNRVSVATIESAGPGVKNHNPSAYPLPFHGTGQMIEQTLAQRQYRATQQVGPQVVQQQQQQTSQLQTNQGQKSDFMSSATYTTG